MSKYPLFSNEVDIEKIIFSDINYSNNKQYSCISYGNTDQTIYLQTPTFKFIQPITPKNNDKSSQSYNELYLFLTPQDPSTYQFVNLMSQIEQKGQEMIDQYQNNISVIPIIKSCVIDDDDNLNESNHNQNHNQNQNLNHNNDSDKDNDNDCKQVIKYLKVKLLDLTQLEYNKQTITISQLNNMLNEVNLKMIFEINMAWITKNKMGIYLKPVKIRAINVPKIIDVEFRDEDSSSDISHLEQTENIKHMINNQSMMSLGDSAFKMDTNKTNLHNIYTTESVAVLDAFIQNNKSQNIQTQLKNELNEIEQIKKQTSIKSKQAPKQAPKQVSKQVSKQSPKQSPKQVYNNKSQYLHNNYTQSQTPTQSQSQSQSQTPTPTPTPTQSNDDNDNSNLNSISVSSEDISVNNLSSSSVEIQKYSRKNNRGRPRKQNSDIKQKKHTNISSNNKKSISMDEKTDSIIKLKKLLSKEEDDDIYDNNNSDQDHDSDSILFELDYNN